MADEKNTFLDTTIRPICFAPVIGRSYTSADALKVGPKLFKKYEYILSICAQLSRLVYCDTGILNKVFVKAFGEPNDEVNNLITEYDKRYLKEKRMKMRSQFLSDYTGSILNTQEINLMESYSLYDNNSPKGAEYGRYISSPEDCTCIIVDAKYVTNTNNKNSIFNGSDIFISFKGSSTMQNFKHDLMSQFSAGEFSTELKKIGINVEPMGNVTVAFVRPILNIFSNLIKELSYFLIKHNSKRIFITGHSLGGAYATFFTWILALAKKSGSFPELSNIESFHLITFGAPTLLSDTARNNFNKLLDDGLITLDRVVSQKVPSRSATTQLAVGAFMGPNNVIPTIPAGFSHPGYRPLLTEMNPEKNGRPYSMDFIRSTYGIPNSGRYRDERTNPFNKLDALDGEINPSSVPTTVQQGGVFGLFEAQKKQYDELTKKRIPNLVSVQGSPRAYAFAHAEYLGMFFFGGFRLAGMKNPASGSYVASFVLNTGNVITRYDKFKPVTEIKEVPESTEANLPPEINPEKQAGGNRTKKRKYKKVKLSKKKHLTIRKKYRNKKN